MIPLVDRAASSTFGVGRGVEDSTVTDAAAAAVPGFLIGENFSRSWATVSLLSSSGRDVRSPPSRRGGDDEVGGDGLPHPPG